MAVRGGFGVRPRGTSVAVYGEYDVAAVTWEAAYGEIREVERFQLSFGQGVRLQLADDESWYFYTYEAGRVALEMARAGVTVRQGVTRMRFADLPR